MQPPTSHDPAFESGLPGLFRDLADEAPDDPTVAVTVRARARRRRATRWTGGVAGTASGLAAAVALAVGGVPAAGVVPAQPIVGSARDALHVTCTPTGVQVDRRSVVAERDGVPVRTEYASGHMDEFVRYEPLGPGDEPNKRYARGGFYAGRMHMDAPPGRIRVGCFSDEVPEPTRWQVVEVVDPHGWFDPTTMADAGCPNFDVESRIPTPGEELKDGEVVVPGLDSTGTGGTPQAAGEDLIRRLAAVWAEAGETPPPYLNQVQPGRPVTVLGGYVRAKRMLLVKTGAKTAVAVADRYGATWEARQIGWCLPDPG